MDEKIATWCCTFSDELFAKATKLLKIELRLLLLPKVILLLPGCSVLNMEIDIRSTVTVLYVKILYFWGGCSLYR